jgi:hypothetical protein
MLMKYRCGSSAQLKSTTISLVNMKSISMHYTRQKTPTISRKPVTISPMRMSFLDLPGRFRSNIGSIRSSSGRRRNQRAISMAITMIPRSPMFSMSLVKALEEIFLKRCCERVRNKALVSKDRLRGEERENRKKYGPPGVES